MEETKMDGIKYYCSWCGNEIFDEYFLSRKLFDKSLRHYHSGCYEPYLRNEEELSRLLDF